MTALPQTISPTVEAIDRQYQADEAAFGEVRGYIGGSSIGHECERMLWYRFRFAHQPERFEGRMLRLFQYGHDAEATMISDLRSIGLDVKDLDPATQQQWAVSECDGHFGGHADGIVTGLLEAPKTPHLLECKTHNAKSFAQLLKHGVAGSKPEHVAQMQVYMHLLGLSRACYMAMNKDTSEYRIERIEYDAAHGATLVAKAERIKDAQTPPARVSDDPGYFLCKAFKCAAYDICHGGEMPLRNCRTCLHVSPIENGNWFCDRHKTALTIDEQKRGCPNHLYLPGLVPGEQIDANPENETVTYRLPDGSEWADGAHREGRAA